MKQGTMVKLDFTAKELLKNEVIDTTIEKVAISEGIFSKNRKYEPIVVVVGEQELPKPVEEALEEIKKGEEKAIRLTAKEAFGERNPKLVGVIPMKEFRQRKIQPAPGLVIDLNGRMGKVQSVSGGRVRVDFNHPLAGKDIEYKVKIHSVIEKPKEQLQALFEKYFSSMPEKDRKMAEKAGVVEITLKGKTQNLGQVKGEFAEKTTKYVKGIQKVRFVEEFGKQEEGKN